MKTINKQIEVRSMPALEEQRNNLIEEMEGLLNKSKEETRAFSEAEEKRFAEISTEVKQIEKTLKAQEEARSMTKREVKKTNTEEEQRSLEEEKFLRFVKGEERALSVGDNGGIIPAHIANKIIDRVKELSPIYSMATVFNVGGDLIFPVYEESSSSIGAAYVDDLTELTEGTGKFTTAKLQNFIIGCLAKLSKSLMNRTDFDLLGFVIEKVAKAIAEFIEKELIQGTDNKMTGILSSTNEVDATAASAITADELIDLQMAVPEVYQGGATFIMHKNTFKAIRKLKDGDGNFLLNKDATTAFGWTLFGKQVYVTESMPEMAAGEKAVVYGDMSGLYVKLAQNISLQILNEKYATQHAVGVVGYVEADSKIIEPQKLAVLKMKAA